MIWITWSLGLVKSSMLLLAVTRWKHHNAHGERRRRGIEWPVFEAYKITGYQRFK